MIIFIMLIFLSINTPSECIKLLANFKINKAIEVYQTLNKSNNSEEMRFLNAYFSRSVDTSIPVYEDIYLSSSNKTLKYLATQKLYEYYFAKGLYIRAQSLKGTLNSNVGQTSPKIKLPNAQNYTLQCGVFGKESNAISLKEKIATIVKNKVYLKKDMINNQEVIRVIIGNITSYEAAESIKNLVDESLKINAMIKSFGE